MIDRKRDGLRILLTNFCLRSETGTELFIRDLALELNRQGRAVAVYAPLLGRLAQDLMSERIPISSSLRGLEFFPDVIHGHHCYPTLRAIQHFPATTAIFVCHDHSSNLDRTPRHPNIRRYFGVSTACIRRLEQEGIPRGEIGFLPNFVDLNRFLPRGPLPAKPRRALLFSNYAHAGTQLPAVKEACRCTGLGLEVVGVRAGNPVQHPENLLAEYDIVFAKGKAAMEAMAVGAAVVLCDFAGVGPMVTSQEFADLRPLNFGFLALREPLQPENLLRQIARYDPIDAFRVRELIRSSAGLDRVASYLMEVYREILEERKSCPSADPPRMSWGVKLSLTRDGIGIRLDRLSERMGVRNRRILMRLPGSSILKRGLRRFLYNDKFNNSK